MHPSDGIGLDVSELLQSAISDAGLPHKVVAIVNDTVACLFTGVSEEVNTKLGLIIGTGFNLSFLRTSEHATQVPVIFLFDFDFGIQLVGIYLTDLQLLMQKWAASVTTASLTSI